MKKITVLCAIILAASSLSAMEQESSRPEDQTPLENALSEISYAKEKKNPFVIFAESKGANVTYNKEDGWVKLWDAQSGSLIKVLWQVYNLKVDSLALYEGILGFRDSNGVLLFGDYVGEVNPSLENEGQERL